MQPLIVTHCGAGSDKTVQDAAEKAAEMGWKILQRGGPALDAVEESTAFLEDDERMNAGTGSRRRTDGTVQMDAALMDSEMRIGAVAAIMNVRNPIRVARLVMDSPHVLLAGEGAVTFARHRGVPFYNPATSKSAEKWREALDEIGSGDVPDWAKKWRGYDIKDTVGAVARDKEGRFASGNSTGGTPFMLPGRVGDSPIPGAGLYAGPLGAVTATGVGEEIIRCIPCKLVYDRIEAGKSVQAACAEALKPFPDTVPFGIIAVERKGWGESANRDMAFAVRPRP